jgi:hypothetical protein
MVSFGVSIGRTSDLEAPIAGSTSEFLSPFREQIPSDPPGPDAQNVHIPEVCGSSNSPDDFVSVSNTMSNGGPLPR